MVYCLVKNQFLHYRGEIAIPERFDISIDNDRTSRLFSFHCISNQKHFISKNLESALVDLSNNTFWYRIPSALGTPDKDQAAGDMLYTQKWYLTAIINPNFPGSKQKVPKGTYGIRVYSQCRAQITEATTETHKSKMTQ